ncbi:hypothetical protein GCM10008943_34150 [Paenochrobactrum glaciei]|uniref:Uncharacterized protein n=1 Tax=Paenochrobactrum glaciei TaxID=486407 RepID=A0ABP3RT00_9HYPH
MVTIPVSGSVLVAIKSVAAGPTGNLKTGIRLRIVIAFSEINRITAAEGGFAGSAYAETAPTIVYIRQRLHGGAGFDYPSWLREQFDVRAIQVYTNWVDVALSASSEP